MSTPLKVAVIGAGVSGLLAGRELLSEGHRIVIYEKMDRPGGTWIYDPRVDSDPLGSDPDREIVHGSLYKSLRTNLPRPAMGFSDYPFEDRVNGDARLFPGHEEVLKFLEDFASDFGLGELIRFGSEVVRVERVDTAGEGEWVVESRSSRVGKEVEVFDAVVVCNGHHTEPRLPNLPGIEKWPGKQIHSHNYRVPEPFRDQVVVMIGSGPSAYDISREIATVAKQVHLSSRAPGIEVAKFKNHDNMWQHSKINYVDEDGTVAFEDGFSIQADTIFHCTGYKFHFPFLKTKGIVSVEDNRVGPLYKHVFPPQLAPRLSFIGLPQKKLIESSLRQQKKLQSMSAYVPSHLPERVTTINQNTSRCVLPEIPKQDLAIGSLKIEEEPAPLPKEKKGRASPPLWYITADELDSLSSYMKGRLTLDKVNAAINDMATYAEANAHLITAPRKKLTENNMDKALELREIATTETVKGKHFFLETDIKGPALKLDNTGKAILTVLRHLGRISESRIGRHRVFVLLNPQ